MATKIHSLIVAAALSLPVGLPLAQDKSIGGGVDKGVELSEPTLYDFLLGEIALQRGDLSLAARTYLDLARRTRDPRVARRAVEVANQARDTELALQAARLWHDIEPASAHALQVQAVAATRLRSRRSNEARVVASRTMSRSPVRPSSGATMRAASPSSLSRRATGRRQRTTVSTRSATMAGALSGSLAARYAVYPDRSARMRQTSSWRGGLGGGVALTLLEPSGPDRSPGTVTPPPRR